MSRSDEGEPVGVLRFDGPLTEAMVETLVRARLWATVARPGDTVVIETEGTDQQLDELTRHLASAKAESGVHFLLLGAGARLARIERPGGQSA